MSKNEIGFLFEAMDQPYEWPVIIELPYKVDDKGQPDFKHLEIICLFNPLNVDEVYEFFNQQEKLFGQEKVDFETKFLLLAVAGWKFGDVKTEAGSDIPDTEENIKKLISNFHVRRALIAAYSESLSTRRKN